MRTTIATLALLLLAPLPAGAAASTEHRTPDGLAVTGYALPSTRPAIVRRDAEALTTVTVASVSLRPSGAGITEPDPRTLRLVEVAHRQGLRAELLVGNYSDRLGGFDPDALSALLSSPASIDTVAGRLAGLVEAGGGTASMSTSSSSGAVTRRVWWTSWPPCASGCRPRRR